MLPDDCRDCSICGVPVWLGSLCDSCQEREDKKYDAAQAVKMYVHNMYGDPLDDVTFEGLYNTLMEHGFYIDWYYPEEHAY